MSFVKNKEETPTSVNAVEQAGLKSLALLFQGGVQGAKPTSTVANEHDNWRRKRTRSPLGTIPH